MSREACTRLADAIACAAENMYQGSNITRGDHRQELQKVVEEFHDAICRACGGSTTRPPAEPGMGHDRPTLPMGVWEAEGQPGWYHALVVLVAVAKRAHAELAAQTDAADWHNNNMPGVGQTVDYKAGYHTLVADLRRSIEMAERQLHHLLRAAYAPQAATPPTLAQAAGPIGRNAPVVVSSQALVDAGRKMYDAAAGALRVLDNLAVTVGCDYGNTRSVLRATLVAWKQAAMPPTLAQDATAVGPWQKDASGHWHCPTCGEAYTTRALAAGCRHVGLIPDGDDDDRDQT